MTTDREAELIRERDEAEQSRTFNHAACIAALDQCDALAAKVEALSDALTDAISSVSSGRIGTCQYGRIYTAQVFLAAVDRWRTALAATPAASLIAHDNALIERCAAVMEKFNSFHANDLRALKTDSEGSTT